MADPVAAVTSTVTAPAGWAKAKPLAFILLILVVVVLTIRFSTRIVGFLAKYKATRWLTGLPAPTATLFLVAAAAAAAIGA